MNNHLASQHESAHVSPLRLLETVLNYSQPLDTEKLRRLIRRQLKAERQTALSDDLLIAAYKQHGSYRKAAAALIAQGLRTNRWAIERAVRRIGGPLAVCRGESSSSITRAFVSHRCDSRKYFSKSSEREKE